MSDRGASVERSLPAAQRDGPAGRSRGDPVSPEFSLDQSIGFLVYRAQLAMKAELGRRFQPHDVTPEQWAVLARLWQQDGLKQRELAERTFKDAANTTRIVQKLERKGFVARRTAVADRRANALYLTVQGRELVSELIPRAQGLLRAALEGVSDEEAEVARRVMDAIFVNMRPTEAGSPGGADGP